MARRSRAWPEARRKTSARPAASPPPTSPQRERIIDAFMALLAEKPIEQIGFAEIAARAGVSLSELRDKFGSTVAILAAQMKETDRAVLAGGDADMAEEPPRERLFDVLMRRLEVLAPHKAAVRSLLRSAGAIRASRFALNGLAVRSQQWMLTAADIDAGRPASGMMRAQGLALLFAQVLRTWVEDDDPGLARTMAALDRALASGQRWSASSTTSAGFPPLPCACARADAGVGATTRRSPRRAINLVSVTPGRARWRRLVHAIALEAQDFDHAIAHRTGKVEAQRPVAVHFKRDARPIRALVLLLGGLHRPHIVRRAASTACPLPPSM